MKHSDFRIGCEFLISGDRWRCTDVGTRTVIAIKLEHEDDLSWYNGPPYAVAEAALDEYDIEACEPAPKTKRSRARPKSAPAKTARAGRPGGVKAAK